VSDGLWITGIVIRGMGWKKIHSAEGNLVTDGIYGRVRHPLYFGLCLVSIGLMIQWPTLVTLFLWPVMFTVYYSLAMKEEKRMIELFGQRYLNYKKSVHAFFPRLLMKKNCVHRCGLE
jgi:protein-S-isoprenylcysteine O-methyltransferase Ste14